MYLSPVQQTNQLDHSVITHLSLYPDRYIRQYTQHKAFLCCARASRHFGSTVAMMMRRSSAVVMIALPKLTWPDRLSCILQKNFLSLSLQQSHQWNRWNRRRGRGTWRGSFQVSWTSFMCEDVCVMRSLTWCCDWLLSWSLVKCMWWFYFELKFFLK